MARYTQPRGRSGRDGARIRVVAAAAAVKYELIVGCQIDLAVKILFIFLHKDVHTFMAPPPPIGAAAAFCLGIYNQGHNQSWSVSHNQWEAYFYLFIYFNFDSLLRLCTVKSGRSR